MNIKPLIIILAVLVLSGGFAFAQIVVDNSDPARSVEAGNKTCPVSGDKVPGPGVKSDMGDQPIKIVYKGKIYNLCCPMCIRDFKKNPDKYSAIADKEVSGQK